ncbi:hypothetical protein L2E82_27120 [Cichorium intybus]|uniref:Uncharacterized protein n=1 Tax=Cichorium intybus TaxID=13427 RepID=A0ACB9CS84_CICIN|nr:hypothetical protein L2E82_27120 [Cichorium intybus]
MSRRPLTATPTCSHLTTTQNPHTTHKIGILMAHVENRSEKIVAEPPDILTTTSKTSPYHSRSSYASSISHRHASSATRETLTLNPKPTISISPASISSYPE